MSLTKDGHSAIFTTAGNEDTHIILRGGSRPNYDTESVDIAANAIQDSGLIPKIMIDFSHANSRKQPDKQMRVAEDVAGQIARGETRIIGAMIESNLVGGRQNLTSGADLIYGQSITDACLAWENTAPLLEHLAEAAEQRRRRR
jgi:3-deoxy-7-phosphoheptulonate synthase